MVWLAAALALGLVSLVVIWNRLATLRAETNAAWADVDVQLQRRRDLVPQLVAAAQGYLDHERGLLDELSARREVAQAAGDDLGRRTAAESALASSFAQVMVRVEAYPQLKASEVMLRLQEDLTSAERRVAMARQRFNETVRDYNTAIGGFPGLLVAQLFAMRSRPMFAAPANAAFAPAIAPAHD
jgi:LemA protein